MVGLLLGQAAHQAYVCVPLISTDGLEENCGFGEMPWVWLETPNCNALWLSMGELLKGWEINFHFDGSIECSP